MKKSLSVLLIGLLLGSIAFTGCDKDDKEDSTNQFVYNGKTVKVIAAEQVYFGDYYETNTNNIELFLDFDNGYSLDAELFVPLSQNKLVDGTYVQNNNGKALTYAAIGIRNNDDELEYVLESGSLTISISGDTYTINVDGKLDNGQTIKGNYTGSLEWSDYSGGSTSGNTFTYNNTTQTIVAAGQIYYGAYANGVNIDLAFIFQNEEAAYFEMFAPLGNTKLVAGTYTMAQTMQARTIYSGSILDSDGNDKYTIPSATITISISGNIYTISVTGTLNGKAITGQYKGELQWLDESKSPAPFAVKASAPKNVFHVKTGKLMQLKKL